MAHLNNNSGTPAGGKQVISAVPGAYLGRMIEDLAEAEKQLRTNIDYRGMSFSQTRLDDCQKNVDRLHELIRTYKHTSGIDLPKYSQGDNNRLSDAQVTNKGADDEENTTSTET